MYFNRKYKHSGTIFQGSYKSKEIPELEVSNVIDYIHLNPAGLLKEADLADPTKRYRIKDAIERSMKYEYSSYPEYLGFIRPQSVIVTVSK